MTYLVRPADCPACAAPLTLTYLQRRQARRTPAALLLIAAVILSVLVLVPLLLLVAREFTAWWTDDLAMARRERGMACIVTYVLMIVPLIFAVRFCWRRMERMSRTAVARCDACGWSGTCTVQEILY